MSSREFFTKPVPDVGVHDLPSKGLYEYYKSRNPRNGITVYREYKKVVGNALKILSRHISDNRGGIAIKGLGYFFVWKIPQRHYSYFTEKDQKKMEGPRPMYNNRYAITFFPVKKYREWHSDGPMGINLRRRVKNNIRSGFGYKMYLYSLRKMRLI